MAQQYEPKHVAILIATAFNKLVVLGGIVVLVIFGSC
jgi:hypothetical protein